MQKITKNFDKPHQATFSRIQRGDITKWAKGASRFIYPEPKQTKAEPMVITSKHACAMHRVHTLVAKESVVMIAAIPESTNRKPDLADTIDRGLEISDMMNRRLGLLK